MAIVAKISILVLTVELSYSLFFFLSYFFVSSMKNSIVDDRHDVHDSSVEPAYSGNV